MAHNNNKVSSSIEEIKGDGSGEFEETIEEFEESNTKESKAQLTNKINIEYKIHGITQNPKTKNYMISLDTPKHIINEIENEINKPYGITQDPETKNYMVVLNYKYTQLSSHDDVEKAIELIPYDRFYDKMHVAKDKFSKVYRAKWIDGNINNWDNENQNWKRKGYNMFVTLKTSKNIIIEIENEINRVYGITQHPNTKNYIMVLNYKCKVCNTICNAIYFQHKFIEWTSGNNDIDKFIQNTQLSSHDNVEKVLEWIPYHRFYDIKYITKDESYRANWVDGNISHWDNENQNWKRKSHYMFVTLKSLLSNTKNITNEIENEINRPYGITQDPKTKNYMISLGTLKNITIEIENEINGPYGITQDPETNNYMIVFNEICEKCSKVCNSIHFQRNFESWTSGNDDIDKFIQETQLSTHDNAKTALEWIPYDRLYGFTNKNPKTKNYMIIWDNSLNAPKNVTIEIENKNNRPYGITQDPETKNYMVSLNTPKNITIEIENEINRPYGITQDPKTKNYMIVFNDICEKYTQLSAHDDAKTALEWIPYDRNNEDMLVALKSLDNSENITLEFINESMLHNKVEKNNNAIVGFYGITQDPNTKNYIMVLGYAKDGSLRNFLDKEYSKLDWDAKIDYLQDIIVGLKSPEILRGQNYTKAADIYSYGLRPRFKFKVPQIIVQLIKRCLDANQLKRTTAEGIIDILHKWQNVSNIKLESQIKEADEINKNSPNNIPLTSLSFKTHSGASYTSRLLNFNNLPEQKNSNDYYEQNDNIISKEFSESLQIDLY
ncbi:kinase-like domain-containing protein [Rhizophagus irregularis DAOM 181602=DAOM 197198]|nr:kinase-like domain-containing protein [Rhizophagus irregularis DAOM 181602=DAOM 197198]